MPIGWIVVGSSRISALRTNRSASAKKAGSSSAESSSSANSGRARNTVEASVRQASAVSRVRSGAGRA